MGRYDRHIILPEIGALGQQLLAEATVLVVGAGGLGCPVLQYLAAAGVGTLGIMDFDTVEESNLQRQVLFGTSSLGINKAIAAKERLYDLNPTIKVNIYPEKLKPSNVVSIFEKYAMIVDATDNFATRYLINDAAVLLEKPVVYGAIFKFEGQVSVFNYKMGPSYRCLFPNPPTPGAVPNCSEIGVLGILPGIIGTMQANEVLKLILNIGEPLSGKLCCYNALNCRSTIIKMNRNEAEIEKVRQRGTDFEYVETAKNCEVSISKITIQEALLRENIVIVDVRELHEEPKIKDVAILKIPLSFLEENLDKINPEKEYAIFCQSGIRSIKAAEIVTAHGYTSCFSVLEGAITVSEIIKKHKEYGNNI